MRRFVVAFVAGCWLLQQQSTLPQQDGLRLGAVVLALVALGMVLWGRRLHVAAHGLALAGLAFGAAFCWAAWRAELRMCDWLPAALEALDLGVRGVVSGLPADAATGTRFAFTVERGEVGQPLPRRVILNWRGAPPDLRPAALHADPTPAASARAGQSFRLRLCLLAAGARLRRHRLCAQGPPQDVSGERLAWQIQARAPLCAITCARHCRPMGASVRC